MGYILLISERADEGEKFSKLFAFGKYEFEVLSDLTYIFDLVNVRVPDVIIFDLFSISVDFKGLLKKIRPLCENSALILNTDNTTADKELLKSANALINDGMNDDLILATISMNLRMKNSMERSMHVLELHMDDCSFIRKRPKCMTEPTRSAKIRNY